MPAKASQKRRHFAFQTPRQFESLCHLPSCVTRWPFQKKLDTGVVSGVDSPERSDLAIKPCPIYHPLKESKKLIRLLKIVSTEPDIRCELKVVSLKESPVFSALSYVWGDAGVTEVISIDGSQLQVTVNLANALRGVHHQWKSGVFSAEADSTKWLWADAVCINQNDTQEKSHQVPLMKDIYSKAQRMFSWLGAEDKDIHKTFDAMHMIRSEISKLPIYKDLLCETNRVGSQTKLECKDPFTIFRNEKLCYELGNLDFFAKYNGLESKTWERPLNLHFIASFFYIPYWNRL